MDDQKNDYQDSSDENENISNIDDSEKSFITHIEL
jgi:hypothetical protein